MPQPPAHLPRATRGPIGVRKIGKTVRTEVLSRPYSNDLTLGTAGQTISPANSAGQAAHQYDDALDIFGNGATYDTTHLHSSSSMAALVAMSNGQTASQTLRYNTLRITPDTVVTCRVYFWIDAAPTQPIQIVRYEDQAGQHLSGVRLTTTPTLSSLRGNNSLIGSLSTTIPTGQWIRVEHQMRTQGTLSYVESRAWWTNPESTGAADWVSANTNVAQPNGDVIDRIMWGSGGTVTALTAAWNIWFAQPAANYTDWVGPATVFGGTTNLLTLTASSTPTTLIANQTAKPIGSSETAAATAPRQAGKLLFISETAAALLTRGAGKPLIASETAATATARQAQKQLAASETATTVVQRRTGKLVLVSETASAALTRVAAKLVAVSETATALLTRSAAKTLAVSETATAVMSRRAGKTAAVTETAVAAILKQVGKLSAVSETASVTLGRIKMTLLTLAASCTPTALLQRQTGKQFAASETATTATQRRVGKALPLSETATTGMSRLTGKLLAATSTATATLTRIKSVQLLLTASSTATAAISRQAGKTLAVTETAVATIQRRAGKMLTATETATSTARRLISHAFAVTCTATVTIAKTANRALAATSAASVSLATSVQTVARRVVQALYGLVAGIGDTGQPSQTGDTGPLDASTAEFGLLPDLLVYPGTDLFPEPYAKIVFAGAAADEEPQTGTTGIPTSTGASGGVTL